MLRLGYFKGFGGDNAILMSGGGPDLKALAASLRALDNPDSVAVRVDQLPFVRSSMPLELMAHPVARELGVRLRSGSSNALRFDWSHSEEGWLEAAEKIEAVADAKSGHAYLGECPAGDAIVVVSKGEYGSEWWDRHGDGGDGRTGVREDS